MRSGSRRWLAISSPTPRCPVGHDAILLSMILHDWGEDRDRAILQKCWAALPSGGMVIISELLVNDEKTGPPAAALMSLNMLVETEGRNYTPPIRRVAGRPGLPHIRTVWFVEWDGRRIHVTCFGPVEPGGADRAARGRRRLAE